jgi:carbon monoxide dehydrogenase subunit G
MAIKTDVKYSRSFSSAKDLKSTFAFLSNLEQAIPKHFPGLETFEKLEPSVYRWAFQKVKHSGYEFQIKVVTRFEFKEPEVIEMVSLPHPEHSTLQGKWQLQGQGGKTIVTFKVDLQAELPLPFFLKAVAAPITQSEISKLFDRYLANVGQALST